MFRRRARLLVKYSVYHWPIISAKGDLVSVWLTRVREMVPVGPHVQSKTGTWTSYSHAHWFHFLDSCSRSCGADIICQHVTPTFSAHASDVILCLATNSITSVTHQAVHVAAADVRRPAWYRSWGWLRHSNQASYRRGPACGRHSNSQVSYRHEELKSDPHGPRSSEPCTAS